MRWGGVALIVLLVLFGCLEARPVVHAEVGRTPTYPVGWNIIAGPEGQVFAGATGAFYSLRPGDSDYRTQPATAAVHATLGYWAFFPQPTAVTLSGDASLPVTLTLPARQQVLVGNPSATETVRVSGADDILRYDADSHTWLLVLTLEPGQGAWAYSQRGGQVTMSALTPPLPPARPVAAQPTPQSPTAAAAAVATPTPVATPAPSARQTPPTPPTGLRGVALDRSRVRFDWTDEADNVDGFVLEDGLDQHRIAVVAPTVKTFTLVALEPATRYCVTVYAFNSAGGSPPSEPACAETPP